MTDIATKLRAALAEKEPAKLTEPSLIQSINEVLELVHQAKSKSKIFAKEITFKVDAKGAGISRLNLSRIRESKPSHEVTTFLAKVQGGAVVFWNPQIQETCTDEQKDFLKLPLNHTLFICLVLEKNEIHYKILRRFARVVLSKLSQNGYTAGSIAQDFHRIGLTTEISLEKLTQQIEAFFIGGGKYRLIGDALGGPGALFFLPSEIGNMVWEKDFLKKGSNHDESIQALRVAGIHDVSKDYHTLAQSLIEEGINSTVTVAQRAISWISEAPKRGSETVQRPDGKRPRYQRSSPKSGGYEASLTLQNEGNSLPVGRSAGNASQDQHLQVPNVANPVSAFQQAAPIPHAQEAYGYTTGNNMGNSENSLHDLSPDHRDNRAQSFDISHSVDEGRDTPHDPFNQAEAPRPNGPFSQNQRDATQPPPQTQMGITHGNLGVSINSAQQKAPLDRNTTGSDPNSQKDIFEQAESHGRTNEAPSAPPDDGGRAGQTAENTLHGKCTML